jgi:hypothetical protein
MKKLILFLLCAGVTVLVKADSPLTSTDLTLGYTNTKNVQEAKNANGTINNNLLKFLAGKGEIAEKMAVICQLGWGDQAMSNAMAFSDYLVKQKKSENKYTGDDYLCLAYIYALGNYFDMTEPLKYATKAIEKNEKSFTFQIISALIVAQVYLDDQNKWCDVFKVCDSVRTDPSLTQDMAAESVKGIFDYINMYQEECK